MPACYVLALGAALLLSAPDTTLSPTLPQQLIKLGVHGFGPGFAALCYERQLSDYWSVLGTLGYSGYTLQSTASVYTAPGVLTWDEYTGRERYYTVGAQLRHYFPGPSSRPLTGWFAAANVQATQHSSSAEYRRYSQQNYTFRRTTAQLQVLAGRQWFLGRRLTLDSYVGISMQQDPRIRMGGAQGVLVEGGVGLQVGYRFRPLLRR